MFVFAGMAQLVEQLIRNQQAAGSSPATSSRSHTFVWGLFCIHLHLRSAMYSTIDKMLNQAVILMGQ